MNGSNKINAIVATHVSCVCLHDDTVDYRMRASCCCILMEILIYELYSYGDNKTHDEEKKM